jgi:tetraacyldisaccharide 4'-kinase
LVTGIANAKPLVEYLAKQDLTFDHIEYPDHHNFKTSEIEMLSQKELILTTEKDYMRLSDNDSLKEILFYLPIQTKIDGVDNFKKEIKSFIT